MIGGLILDQIEITLKDDDTGHLLPVYVDVFDNSLSKKWLAALNQLITDQYHLEKNYCFFGFTSSKRNATYLCQQINESIAVINEANIGYTIDNHYTVENTIADNGMLIHDKTNWLHRYFEDLQGVSGNMSPFYTKANPTVRWHIRQLNLLCHEYESLVLSLRKLKDAPEWRRPSQLMCWLKAPRFMLDASDYEFFGIETLNRPLGGVFVGVNKAVGKHHWEVYQDEGRDSRLDELVTTSLRSQTEAAGDFDIEWANNPGEYIWQKRRIEGFRQWLTDNGFDPNDKSLTIGHPQCGQVDLQRSFGTESYVDIWSQLDTHLNVYAIKTSQASAVYSYNWSDADYVQQQIRILS